MPTATLLTEWAMCCDGTISKTSTRPTRTSFAVAVTITRYRAYTIRSVTATWTYKKRI